MKPRFAAIAIALAVLSGGQFRVPAAAADAFERSTAFLAATLTRFLDDNASLTGTTRLTITQPAGDGGATTFELGTALDRGKMRFDLDLTSDANKIMNTGLPQMGIRRMMFIGYPDHPLRIVFPDLKTFIEVPLGSAGRITDQAGLAASRLDRKLVGEENIGGVPTRKYQLHTQGSEDLSHVWEAPGLNNLPVQLRTASGGRVYTFTFSNLRLGQPDARVFGIPASYQKMGGFQEVLNVGIARLTEQMNKALAPK